MNGIIIVDKPEGWTSHDVVGKLRRLCSEKRVGHGGTLDPMATGILPVFIGRATRAVEFMENSDKEYLAGIRFGIETDTQDITGTVLKETDCSVSKEELSKILVEFTGEIQQIPPMYSALKVNGKKLYELARKGIEVERKPRTITVSGLEIIDGEINDFVISAVVSKGTYIRTLCNDIGKRLGCGGVMTTLRRTGVGVYGENDAVTMEELIKAAEDGCIEKYLRPVDSIFAAYPWICVDDLCERRCRNGNDFLTDAANGVYRVYSGRKEFLMLGRAENGRMKTVKSFFEV